MDLGPLITNPRIWIPLVLFAAFLLWEWFAPFRVSIRSKLHHVSTNLVLFGTNSLIASAIAGWIVLLQRNRPAGNGWGMLQQLHVGGFTNVVLSVILLDFTLYGFHWFSHRIPFLWRFHRTHHSDLDVDVTTSIRFHLGEVLISSGFKVVAVSVIGVSPASFLISETALLTASQFQHSNIRLRSGFERWMQQAFVTPSMHWIHHSRRPLEHHSNFGVMISVWDRIFGTRVQNVERREIQLGLNRYSKPEDVELLRLYRIPLDPA